MPQHFLTCEREQQYLMPPCLRDWLPQNQLAWFVLDAVAGAERSTVFLDT